MDELEKVAGGRCEDEDRPAPERQALETRVRRCGAEGVPLAVKQDVDGVRHQDDVDQDAAEIDDMLNRMHGEPGPGPDVVVTVMNSVGDFVQRHPMQEAVDEVKV